MTPEEKAKYQYRFSGYTLPMIQLDSTGPSFAIVQVHPYYLNQPVCWSKSHFYGHPNGDGQIYSSKQRLFPFLQNDENT